MEITVAMGFVSEMPPMLPSITLKPIAVRDGRDGIDTFAASNISFNDLYMRTGDDSIAIYGSRFNGGMTWTW